MIKEVRAMIFVILKIVVIKIEVPVIINNNSSSKDITINNNDNRTHYY